MNYPAMRWLTSADCHVKAPARPILWVIAYHADRDTGECWLGQRALARETGYARSTVQEAMNGLFGDAILEFVEASKGPHPDRYRIAPELVEGEAGAGASGIVEGQASAFQVVEGTSEVIHRPPASGPAGGPLAVVEAELVDRSSAASGPTMTELLDLVDRSSYVTGPETSALSSGNGSQGLKQGFLRSREEQVRVAEPNADALGDAVAYTPPEVSEAHREWLRHRGLGQKQPPPTVRPLAPPGAPTMDRDRQLAELRRRNPAEFAEQERQEREGATPHVQAHAGVAIGSGVANPATIAITVGIPQTTAVTGRATGEQRMDGRARGQVVDVGQAVEVELAGEAGAATDALGVLRVVNE